MDMPVIYLIIILSYMILILGFIIKEFTFLMLAGFLLMGLSVYTFTNGIGIFLHSNFLVIIFSAITFSIGAYCSMRTVLELITENY